MSTTPFDLVILDLDGTIIDQYQPGEVAPAVQEAIAEVQAAGVPVTIGTGRTLAYIRQHLGYLKLRTPAVTTQGAVIGDPISGRVLHLAEMPRTTIAQVVDWMEARPNQVCAFYFYADDGTVHIHQNRHGALALNFYDYVLTTPRAIAQNLAVLIAGDHLPPPVKFLAVNDVAHEEDIAPLLRAQFGESCTIVRTHPLLVEGTARGVDKGYGVRQLCQLLGIDPARVLAIGDADNDIPMLQTVGMPIAMGGSTPGALAAAKWVAPPLKEHGVAVALRKFILGYG